jgi:hypothetical protein
VIVLVVAGCSKNSPTPTIHKPHATISRAKQFPPSNWQEGKLVDAMTDVVHYSVGTEDHNRHGSLMFMCDVDGESASFSSPLFLGGGAVGKILVRYDNDKAMEEKAFLLKQTALIRLPVKLHDFRKAIDLALLELAADAFFAQLEHSLPHKRMRVRLTAFDGSTSDLDFDIEGVQAKLAQLEKRCGSKK